jgi:hypothetical protein
MTYTHLCSSKSRNSSKRFLYISRLENRSEVVRLDIVSHCAEGERRGRRSDHRDVAICQSRFDEVFDLFTAIVDTICQSRAKRPYKRDIFGHFHARNRLASCDWQQVCFKNPWHSRVTPACAPCCNSRAVTHHHDGGGSASAEGTASPRSLLIKVCKC